METSVSGYTSGLLIRGPKGPVGSNPTVSAVFITYMKTYKKIVKIFDINFASCYIYVMSPGGFEGRHYHEEWELEYVFSGSTSTHKKGKLYFRKSGEIHTGINDTDKDLVFLCLTIPAENEKNTHYTN